MLVFLIECNVTDGWIHKLLGHFVSVEKSFAFLFRGEKLIFFFLNQTLSKYMEIQKKPANYLYHLVVLMETLLSHFSNLKNDGTNPHML